MDICHLRSNHALLQQLVTAQEEERHRIARELHDEMGQHLTTLILGLKSLKDSLPVSSPAHEGVQQLRQLADLIARQVHHLALRLRPTALDNLGLQMALMNYVDEWSERFGIDVDFQSIGLDSARLPLEIETALYRIIQEGLTNVLRHAEARLVSLSVQRSREQVVAILEDNGHGFDTEKVMNPRSTQDHLGLLGMRERVALLGGTWTVESKPGKGTTILVRIPLPVAASEGNRHD